MTTIQPIDDGTKLLQEIESWQKRKLQRELEHITVSLKGLPGTEDTHRLEANIRKLITSEIRKYSQNPALAVPSNALLPDTDTTPDVHISLSKLGIPNEKVQLLEAHLENKIKAELGKNQLALASICATVIPGKMVDFSPVLTAINTVPPRNGEWTIAWFEPNSTNPEDVFRIEVFADPLPRKDNAVVGLAVTTSSCWAKEIELFNMCQNRVGSIYMGGCNAVPNSVLITQQDVDTIVFRKPKFLGIWTDMYNDDPTQFWQIFGGRTTVFTWFAD